MSDATNKIDATHRKYDANVAKWNRISLVVRGGDDVKCLLPRMNPCDKSPENALRNEEYRERATFLRIAGRTVDGMVGLAFRRPPTLDIPDGLAYVKNNVDGAATSIYGQSQDVLSEVLSKGRAGMLVDYPITEGGVSVADVRAGRVFATLRWFEPEQIINWGVVSDGAAVRLGRVVLRYEVDGLYGEVIDVIRELIIEDGVYVSREYRKGEDDEWELYSETYPRDGSGQPWREIPFVFVGAKSNSWGVDDAPMSDIVGINIAHYRNSADYEDSVHFVGQAQPVVVGADEFWLKEYKNDTKMYVGSRALMIIPHGGDYKFAQPTPNTMVKEAMDSKWESAISMGAHLLTPGSAVKTATQAAGEQVAQTSILSLATGNVSEAYTIAIRWMCQYMDIDIPDDVEHAYEYAISTDFFDADMDANMIRELAALVLQGLMPMSDFFENLKKGGKIDAEKNTTEIKEEIAADRVADVSMPNLEPEDGDDGNDNEAKLAALLAAHPELSETPGA